MNYRSALLCSTCMMVGALAVLLRLSSLQNLYDGALLWGEDGRIFYNQALEMGLESLFCTYAGYIHLYPRLVAYLASYMNIAHVPILFSAAWLFSYMFMLLQVFSFLESRKIHYRTIMIVCVLIGIIPHSGESFFNITNSQFFLAIGFLLFFLSRNRFGINVVNVIVLVFLGLTGPFSLLFLPVLLACVLIRKDFKDNHVKYVVVAVVALIQLLLMLTSTTRYGGDLDTDIVHWLRSIYVFVTFGGRGLISVISIAVWSILLVHLVSAVRNIYKKKGLSGNQKDGLLLVSTLTVLYFAGLWTYKQYPLALHPLEGGARYFVIPYALLVVVLPLLIRDRRFFYFSVISLTIIGMKQFTTIERKHLNFDSYAWLSGHVESLSIPIHPQWETFPGWCIEFGRPQTQESNDCFCLDISELHTARGSEEEDPFLVFDVPSECTSSKHIGVLVDVTRQREGWGKIFYAVEKGGFTSSNSLKRYYPKGNIVMQFAFRNVQIGKVRLDLSQHEDESVVINDIRVCCE